VLVPVVVPVALPLPAHAVKSTARRITLNVVVNLRLFDRNNFIVDASLSLKGCKMRTQVNKLPTQNHSEYDKMSKKAHRSIHCKCPKIRWRNDCQDVVL